MLVKMGRVVEVFGFLGLYASFCSAQEPKVPSWQMPPFQSGGLSNSVVQSQPAKAAEAMQQGGNQPQQFFPENDQSWLQVPPTSADLQSCEVTELSRVGCGEPGISLADCEALNCCFDNSWYFRAPDSPMCYYGKAVTVQCTKDGQFVLVISRDATLPRISLDSISIVEASGGPCTAVDSNADFAIYQFPVTACGTRTKVDGDYLVYENMMASSYEVEVGPRGVITRDSSFELTFQCRYLATAVVGLVVDVHTLPPPLPVVQQGALRVELRLANGVCATKGCSDADVYSSYYSEADYPVTKVLRDPVYVEVRMLERADPNIALVLNHCWATNSPDSSSTPQWDLLANGCPYEDDRYRTMVVPVGTSSGLQYPTHYKRFVVKMFTFVDESSFVQQEQLFIHCSSAVCQLSDTESCKPSCVRMRRSVSDAQDSEKKVLVSSGMVHFIADLPVSAKSQADDHEVSQGIGYGLYGVAALTVLSVSALLIAVLRRRSKPQPRLQVTRL